MAEDGRRAKLFYRTSKPSISVVIGFTVSDGEYLLGRNVWVFDPASAQGRLSTVETDALLQEVVKRLIANGIYARVQE